MKYLIFIISLCIFIEVSAEDTATPAEETAAVQPEGVVDEQAEAAQEMMFIVTQKLECPSLFQIDSSVQCNMNGSTLSCTAKPSE